VVPVARGVWVSGRGSRSENGPAPWSFRVGTSCQVRALLRAAR